MLRYKTETRPGLVALYDFWPGNGAGPFLQPRSPHRANIFSGRTICIAMLFIHSFQRCYQDQGVRDQDQTKARQAETETKTKTRQAETETETKTREAETKTKTKTSKKWS